MTPHEITANLHLFFLLLQGKNTVEPLK